MNSVRHPVPPNSFVGFIFLVFYFFWKWLLVTHPTTPTITRELYGRVPHTVFLPSSPLLLPQVSFLPLVGFQGSFSCWNFIVYRLSLYFDSSHWVSFSSAILPGHLKQLFLTWCLPCQTTHFQKAQSVAGCSAMGSFLGFNGIYFVASWGKDVSSKISKNNCSFLPPSISISSVSMGSIEWPKSYRPSVDQF